MVRSGVPSQQRHAGSLGESSPPQIAGSIGLLTTYQRVTMREALGMACVSTRVGSIPAGPHPRDNHQSEGDHMKGYGVKVGVAIDDIDPLLKPASLMRATLNDEAIETYAASFDKMPPVKLMVNPDDGHHWVVDGAHTISAARKLGLKDVPAIVSRGTYHEAFKEAAHSNIEHGVRVTNDDKRHRVKVALEDPVMRGWSNPLIADTCGVSHMTVSRMRPDNNLNNVQVDPRIGRDGKARSAPKPKRPRNEPFTCPQCGEEFNAPVWHCHQCGEHWPTAQTTCPDCHVSDVTFDETADTKADIDEAFPAREGEGWQDNPALAVEPQREPLPGQTTFDFDEFWRPVSRTISDQFDRCPADYRQNFVDALERKYQVLFRRVPGAVRFELEEIANV